MTEAPRVPSSGETGQRRRPRGAMLGFRRTDRVSPSEVFHG
jgi:hypothetical protein